MIRCCRNQKLWNSHSVWFAVVSVLWLLACTPNTETSAEAEPPPPPITSPTEPSVEPSIRVHVYELYEQDQSLSRGYGAYTYVLSVNPAFQREYGALLAQVMAQAAPSSALPARADKSRVNLFVVPAEQGQPSITFSFQLAVLFLEHFDIQLTGEGPYLVTLLQPIEHLPDGPTEMLYVDLSDYHIGSYPEIVNAYKARLQEAIPNEAERFESFKISLLSHAFILRDGLRQVVVSSAQARELAEAMGIVKS